jgi:site-specific DNA-methyltransferase (adenine-specific)
MNWTDKINVTNEDNIELMSRYPDKYFDLAIVDPPYRENNSPTKEMRQNGSMKSIKIKPNKNYFNELFRVSKNQIIWGVNNFDIKEYKGFIIWNKCLTGVKDKYSECELAYVNENLSTISRIFEYKTQNKPENKIHPTQKPVTLYKWILDNYAKQGDKILDTHLGSGSIAIACHDYGFELTACELDKEYYDASYKRFKNHISQQRIEF